MNLTNEEIRAILDGAPEGSPYVNVTNQFGAIYLNGSGETHVISDLREILTLRQEVERLKVEVESKNHDKIEAVKKARTQWAREDVASIKKRESEVAARAVEKAVRKYRMRLLDGPDIYSDALIEYANQLRKGECDE